MALAFAFPCLWLYTLYYLVKKWDGTAPFQLVAGALFGCGSLLIVTVAILIPASVRQHEEQQQKRQQFWSLAKFGMAVHKVCDDGQRPDSNLIQKKLEDEGYMTAEQYKQFLQDYEIRWEVLPRRLDFVKDRSAVVIAYHRASFVDRRDTVATGFLDGQVNHLPCDELTRILKP
jgi:hypothetical protein